MVWLRRQSVRRAGELREAYNARHEAGFLRDGPRFYRAIARRMSAARGERVLDSGCGGGDLLRELPGCDRVGLDISDVALAEARRVVPDAKLVLGQGEALPFPDEVFDQTVCLGNLEHFLDPELGARELARVTKRDGVVWVMLPNSYYSGDIWRVLRTGYGPNHHQPVERFGTLNEWRDLLEGSGLRVDDVSPYNRFKWWKRLLPRAFAYHFLYRCRPRP